MANLAQETFFARVKRLGPREVSRQLGFDDGFMSRCARGLTGINEAVIAKCAEVWGAEFDQVGTLSEWYERWLARHEQKATAAHEQPSDGGHTDAT